MQFTKILDAQTGVTHNAAHCECVDGIVRRNCQNSSTVSHDDVSALPNEAESSFFKRGNCAKVVDPWKLSQNLSLPAFNFRLCHRNFDDSAPGVPRQFLGRLNIFADRDANVGERFLFCYALRPASGQAGARNAETLFRLSQDHAIGCHRRYRTPNLTPPWPTPTRRFPCP